MVAATQITVLYPNESDLDFNMDYYLTTYMPMVAQELTPFNFHGYSVLKLGAAPDGKPSPYAVQATLYFDSPDDFKRALETSYAKITADVPKFSKHSAMWMVGEEVAWDVK